jgi:hypothetical protein
MKDLILLAADPSMKLMLQAVLDRPESLGIQPLSKSGRLVIDHPLRDPGVFKAGHEFLRSQSNQYRHAIMICDRHGSGQEHLSSTAMEDEMQTRLDRSAWRGRSAAIVIDPELEIWAFSRSPHVASALGWDSIEKMHRWLHEEGYLFDANGKPDRPKEAMEQARRFNHIPRSSSIFVEIARKVSIQACRDRAFKKLRSTLQTWFPPLPPHR